MRWSWPASDPAAGVAPALRRALADDLRTGAFGIGAPPRPRRIGAEVELIPVGVGTGAPVPILEPDGSGTLPLLRAHAAAAGWVEEAHPACGSLFRLPGGGMVSYEPGGQIELSSAPCASVGALVRALHEGVLPLRRRMLDAGVHLLAVGIDPETPLERAPLRLRSERYARMDAHFSRVGPAGARMMRQTASLQINLDWEEEPAERWHLLNAAAPYLTAIFANSPRYAGAATGAASYRARCWRELDPPRTGLLPHADDPAEAYLDFALRAPALLLGPADGEPLPMGEWLRRTPAAADAWPQHLTTLFPEVRPKGFAEVRSLDALEPAWYAAPLVLLAGLLHHPVARAEAAALLGPPDPALLARAGEAGLADPEIAGVARQLWEVALAGAAGVGEPFVDGASLEVAREFVERFTLRGRAPADDPVSIPQSSERRTA